MITGLTLTIVLFVIVSLFFLMDFFFMYRYDRERVDERKGWAWDYTLSTIGLGLIIIFQPVLLPRISLHTPEKWGLVIQILGLFLVGTSFGLHIWARRHIKKFYTERIEVQTDHKLIDSGPYALVRHPIITSFFALVLGILFINPALTSLAAVIYAFWDFLQAAKKEESALSQTIPDYAEYMQRIPRFLPRLRKKS